MHGLKGLAVAGAAVAAIALPAVTFSATPPEHGYVSSTLVLPASTNEAKTLARDINGDGHPDNALGSLFVAFATNGLDLRTATQSDVTGGELLMLGSLRTVSFVKDNKATWQVLYGAATPSPNFSGAGSFRVDPTALRSARLAAQISKHHVTTVAGTIPVKIDFGGGITTFMLRSGKIFATCSVSACTKGRVTGVVTKGDVTNVLIPQLANQFSLILMRDCPGPAFTSCADGSTGKILEGLFDTNKDLVITTTELLQNPLLQALLAPDIDTNHDHKADALS